MGIECSDNIYLEKSSSSAGSMSASPVKSKNMYWTSFFESDNIMPKDITVTLEFKCPANTNLASVVIKEVNILTKNSVEILTEKLTPNIKVISGVSESIVNSVTEDSTESSKKIENNTENNTESNLMYIDNTNSNKKESSTLPYKKSEENSVDVIKTGQKECFYLFIIVMFVSGLMIFILIKKDFSYKEYLAKKTPKR